MDPNHPTAFPRPILYNSDPSSLASNYLPDPVQEDDLRRLIDMMADAGVTHYVQQCYSQCCTAWWRSETYAYDHRDQHKRFIPMIGSGVQPLEVLADQCHQRGMQFIAGIRMNDTHGYKRLEGQTKPWYGDTIAAVIEENPDWELTAFAEETEHDDFYALDFSAEGVRDFTARVMEETIDRFDIDGIELCFRDPGYFPHGEGRERAPLMTELFRRIRQRLDEKGRETGKKLLLGARVIPTLEQSLDKGLDVAAWVREGLLDYLSPMDCMWTDLNLSFHEFSALTRDSECKLWPGILPWHSQRSRIRLRAAPLSSANCRAYAHSCYRNGADGLAFFNHCTVTRNYPYFPQLLQVCRQVNDPRKVAKGERHYIYEPMWAGLKEYHEIQDSKRHTRADHILLDRSTDHPTGEAHLNLYEDRDKGPSMQLLFRGFGLTDSDELEVRFNGHLVDDRDIDRTRQSDCPIDHWNDPRTSRDGRSWKTNPEIRVDFGPEPHPAFSTRWFKLDPSIVQQGQNVLSISLAEGNPRASGDIVIDEFEIWVDPR